jgi:transcriptional regulator with XRE-family HTH domain
MYTYSKLRGKITEKFGTQQALAEELGISVVSVSKKLNGATGFSQEDIEAWAKVLDIKRCEYPAYFFA